MPSKSSQGIDPVRSPLAIWFANLAHGPLEPSGDYFEKLGREVASSAPLARGRSAC